MLASNLNFYSSWVK